MRTKWGVCSNDNCNKWGIAPPEFREKIHFLKCGECGSAMYLTIFNPAESGYQERNKVSVGVMNQS